MITQTPDTSAEIITSINPFPGLRPFEYEESHLFFGRDGQSEQLISKLARTRFLAVVGTSGGGKSSLVRAGLLPTLHGGFMTSAGSGWRIAILRPGNDPIGNLALALNAPEVFGSEIEENAAIQTAVTEASLRRGGLGLVDAVRQSLMSQSENLLVVVDQFEEIFRFARVSQGKEYQNEAAAFVKLILEASRQREVPIYIVLTMRSDYLGDCSQFWDLPETINDSQYLVPRLTRDQLREAIIGPVAVGGGEITPRLVNRLLNDVGDDQDQLPILQHALMRSWDDWKSKSHNHFTQPEGNAIDLCCYESIGGMAEALSRHADEAFNELTHAQQKLAEQIFKALTEKGEDNRETRHPLTVREICAVTEAGEKEVIAVIETFRLPGRSFLMPPVGVALTVDSLIDISHESLIRNWTRLCGWVEDESRCARTYRRLAETALLYQTGEAGFWRDPDLQIALDWRNRIRPNEPWARRYHSGFNSAMDFLQASKQKQDEEIAEREREQKAKLERAQREVEQAQALVEAQQQRAEAEKQRAMEEERRANAEQQKAEESQRRVEEQARAAVRLRHLVAALIFTAIIAFTVAAIALYLWREANNAKQMALKLQGQTEARRQELDQKVKEIDGKNKELEGKNKELDGQKKDINEKNAKLIIAQQTADEQRHKALRAQRESKVQEKIAIKARIEAETNLKTAKQNEQRAKDEKQIAQKARDDLEIANKKVRAEQQIANSRLLAKAAVDSVESRTHSNPTRGALLALYSISRLLNDDDLKIKPKDFEDGLKALQQAIPASFLREKYEDARVGSAESVGFNEKGEIVTATKSGTDSRVPEIMERPIMPAANANGTIESSLVGPSFRLEPDANRRVSTVTVSPDGAFFAIGQDDGKVKALDLTSKDRFESRAHRHPIHQIALSNRMNGGKGHQTLLANASVFWSSSVTELKQPRARRGWRKPTLVGWARIIFGIARSNHLVSAMSFSPEGSLVAIARQDGIIELRDPQKDGRIQLMWESSREPVLGLAFNPLFGRDSKRLAVVTRNRIVVWDISTLKRRKYGMFETHKDDPPPIVFELNGLDLTGAVTYSPDGRLIAAAAQDGRVILWDMSDEKDPREKRLVTLNERGGRVSGLAFNSYFKPDEFTYQLATVSAEEQATKVWQLPSLEKLSDLQRVMKRLSDLNQGVENDYGTADRQSLGTLLKEAASFLPTKRRRFTTAEENQYVKPLEQGERP